MGSDFNKITIFTKNGKKLNTDKLPKKQIAKYIIDNVIVDLCK